MFSSLGPSVWNRLSVGLVLMLAVTAGSAPVGWVYTTGNYAWAAMVSRDGRYVVAGSDDMHTYFFRVNGEGKPVWTHVGQGYVRHVAVSGDGACAAVSDTAGNVYFFQSNRSGIPAWSFHSAAAIDGVDLSEDASRLVVGDREGNIYLFETSQSNQPVWHAVIDGGFMSLALFGLNALAASSRHGGIYFYDLVLSKSSYGWSFHESTSFPQLAVSEDLGYIFAGGSDGDVYVISSSGRTIGSQRLGGSVSAISISESARVVIAGSTNGNVSQYLIKDRLESAGSALAHAPITSVAVSDDGKRIAIATIDGIISMFSQTLADPLWTYKAGAIVHSLSMSGNGMVMAASSDSGKIYLFNERMEVQTQGSSFVTLLIPIAVTVILVACLVWRTKKNRGPKR